MKKFLRILLIISVFVSFFIFLRSTDISESIRLIQQLGSKVVFIFLSTFSAYWFGALGWKYCIDSETKPSLLQLFIYRHIGNTVTLFNPTSAIAGEMFNAGMLIKHGISNQVAYKSVLLSRIMMMLSQILILVVTLLVFLFALSHQLPETTKLFCYLSFALAIVAIAGTLLFLLNNKKEQRPTSIPIGKKWKRTLYRIEEMRRSLAEHVHRRPKETSIAFIAFSIQWILSSLELYYILSSMGLNVNMWDTLFMDTVIIVSKSAVSFIPGQLGAEELINKFVLYLGGIDSPSLWLSVSILKRARQLFWSGIALVFYIGLKRGVKFRNRGNIIRES